MAASPDVAMSLKRPLPEDEPAKMPDTPSETTSTAGSSPLSSPATKHSQDVSILPSDNNGVQSDPPASNPSSTIPPNTTQKTAPPQKRRKITPLERAQEQAEKAARKEAREKEKAAREKEKAAKDKEKAEAAAKKEEEKRKKAEELEQKRKIKAAEQKAKEEERLRKVAEVEAKKKAREEGKKRKDHSQTRLSDFFNNPKNDSPATSSDSKTLKASPSPSPAKFITKVEARRKSLSLEPGETVDSSLADIPKLNLKSNSSVQIKKPKFLPYNVPKLATLAPHNRFLPLEEELARINANLDSYFVPDSETATFNANLDLGAEYLKALGGYKKERGYVPLAVKDIVERIHGSSHLSIGLNSDQEEQPEALLQGCQMKYLHFGQDVRPPYCGTWTKPQPLGKARALARNPFKQLLPQLDYDYDSEAEWEEPEEGEDIDSDGEEEEEEVDEDMEGFLDDESPPDYLQARKGQMSNELVPVCTGLQWEDASGVLHAADGGAAADFSNLKMGSLLDPRPPTIDPFTRLYWEDEVPMDLVLSKKEQAGLSFSGTGLMNPPRIPLGNRPYGFLNGTEATLTVNGKVPKAAKPTKGGRVVSADLLPAFKKEVAGSDMTKLAITEHLKAKFPKLKKDDITATLNLVAHRVRIGTKSSKKWVLLEAEP